jgi:hypothetical protein
VPRLSFAGHWLHQEKSTIHLERIYWANRRNFVGQSFWALGYSVSPVGRDEVVIQNYIRNQGQEDQRLEKMNLCLWPATSVATRTRGRVSDPDRRFERRQS